MKYLLLCLSLSFTQLNAQSSAAEMQPLPVAEQTRLAPLPFLPLHRLAHRMYRPLRPPRLFSAFDCGNLQIQVLPTQASPDQLAYQFPIIGASATESTVESINTYPTDREVRLYFPPDRVGESALLQLHTSDGQSLLHRRTQLFPTLSVRLPTPNGSTRLLWLTIRYADGELQTYSLLQSKP